MDIKPIRSLRNKPVVAPKPQQTQLDDATPLKVPEELLRSGNKVPLIPATNPKRSRKKWWIIGAAAALVLFIIAATVGWFWWYNDALQPRSSVNQRVRVTIDQGSTPDQIANKLEGTGVIKNSFAFQLLVKQSGDRDKLQAGTYLL